MPLGTRRQSLWLLNSEGWHLKREGYEVGCFTSHFGWRLQVLLQPGSEKAVSARQRDGQGFGSTGVGVWGEDLLPRGGDPAAVSGAPTCAPCEAF